MKILPLICLVALAGCSSVSDYYHPENQTTNPNYTTNYGKVSLEIPVKKLTPNDISFRKVKDLNTGTNEELNQGYVPLGNTSTTRADSPEVSDYKEYATEINAKHAIITEKDLGQRSMTLGSCVQNTGGFTANSIVSNGFNNTYITTTAQATGCHNEYHNFTYEVIKESVGFFAKDLNKNNLGMYFQKMPDDMRTKIQTHKGKLIRAIVTHSPAYDQDIMPNDILFSIDGKFVTEDDVVDIQPTKTDHAIVIGRDGKFITKTINY